MIERCQERNKEIGQCELRDGHDGQHLAGYFLWPSAPAEPQGDAPRTLKRPHRLSDETLKEFGIKRDAASEPKCKYCGNPKWQPAYFMPEVPPNGMWWHKNLAGDIAMPCTKSSADHPSAQFDWYWRSNPSNFEQVTTLDGQMILAWHAWSAALYLNGLSVEAAEQRATRAALEAAAAFAIKFTAQKVGAGSPWGKQLADGILALSAPAVTPPTELKCWYCKGENGNHDPNCVTGNGAYHAAIPQPDRLAAPPTQAEYEKVLWDRCFKVANRVAKEFCGDSETVMEIILADLLSEFVKPWIFQSAPPLAAFRALAEKWRSPEWAYAHLGPAADKPTEDICADELDALIAEAEKGKPK